MAEKDSEAEDNARAAAAARAQMRLVVTIVKFSASNGHRDAPMEPSRTRQGDAVGEAEQKGAEDLFLVLVQFAHYKPKML